MSPVVPNIANPTVASSKEPAAPRPDLAPRDYARAVRRILLLLLVLGVVQRVARLVVCAPIWGDEAMLALNFLDRDFEGLTHSLSGGQVAPVLFLWAERLVVVLLGTAEWMMRLPPFLASVGALFLMWDFARRTVSPTAAALAVGNLAVAVWPVSMAATLKPYAGDLFWSALLLALAARWHQRPERTWPLAALVPAVPLALGSSYPTVFVAGAVSLYLLPLARTATRRQQAIYLGYNAAMLTAFLATYFVVGRAQIDPAAGPTGSFMRWYWRDGFPPESVLEYPLWFLKANSGRMFAYPFGDANGGSSLTTLLFVLGAWLCWRNGSRPLVVLCLVPFALNLLAAILQKYPYAGCCRLSQHLAPAICLLSAVGWAKAIEWAAPRRDIRLRLVQIAAGFLITFGMVELIHRCLKLDHDPAAGFAAHFYDELNRELRPGDRVVLTDYDSCDTCTQWYLRRLGDRLLVAPPGRPLPDADRLWAVSMAANAPHRREHEEFIRLATGWRPLDTVWYSIRPDGYAEVVWWYTGVTCLVRPEDRSPPPMLNISP